MIIGKDTNGSQFFITLGPCTWLDGKHVIFGQVIQGEKCVLEIERVGTRSGSTTSKVCIIDCGEVGGLSSPKKVKSGETPPYKIAGSSKTASSPNERRHSKFD